MIKRGILNAANTEPITNCRGRADKSDAVDK